MNIEYIKTEELQGYKTNTRTHSSEQVQQLANSITEFGFTNPVLIDGERQIIAGHGRLAAAKKLLMDEIPCIVLDHLSDEQRRAYVIADNKLALNAGWDEDLLKLELSALDRVGFDLSVLGFDVNELSGLVIDEDAITGGLTDEDDVPEVVENSISKLGDVWLLGKHRVMCGDSTKTEDVTLLMNDEEADMVFTDPPYNIDYQGVSDKRDKIKNDKMPDEDFVKFLYSSIMPNDTMYVCCSWQYAHLFKEAMEIMDKKPKAMIVWDKVNPAQHLDKYYKQHEIIFYYGAFGGNKTLRGDVWQLKRQRNTVHPTMKPIELIEMALIDQPNKNIIYDGFLGSGSTLIACEKNNRKCYGMELESKYVDVIVKRWQEYTGKEAFHEVSGQKFNEALNG